MDILAIINRATELVDEGLTMYSQAKNAISKAGDDLSKETLEEAQAALANSLQRAHSAHDGLKAAIDARLGQL